MQIVDLIFRFRWTAEDSWRSKQLQRSFSASTSLSTVWVRSSQVPCYEDVHLPVRAIKEFKDPYAAYCNGFHSKFLVLRVRNGGKTGKTARKRAKQVKSDKNLNLNACRGNAVQQVGNVFFLDFLQEMSEEGNNKITLFHTVKASRPRTYDGHQLPWKPITAFFVGRVSF